MSPVEQLPVWRTAVGLVGDADIQVRVYTDADPPFRPVNLGHCSPIRKRDIVAAAQHYDTLAVTDDLRNHSRLHVVSILERTVYPHISEVEYPSFDIKRGEF